MSAIAVALKHMLAAGMPHDAIVAAVAEMEAGIAVDEVAERRRAYDRERKAKAKAERSGGIPVESAESVECVETPLSRPPNDNNSNPPTHTPEKQTPRARGKHPMPVGWEPAPLTGDAAQAAALWPPGAVERELARFRDWAAGGGPNTRKENWDATWRNWIRRAQDEGKYRGQPQQRQQRDPASTIDAVQRAIELTGGATGCDPVGSGRGDQRIGQVPDPMRAIGHVER